MPRPLIVLILVSLSGCLGIYRAIAGEENPDITEVRKVAKRDFFQGCPGEITIEERDWRREMAWLVTGCSGKASCIRRENEWRCFSNPPKVSDWGKEWLPVGFEAASVVAAQASGCSASEARITMVEEPERSHMGTYSATLCGRSFRCLLSMTRRGEFDLTESKCDETAVESGVGVSESNRTVIGRLALETGCGTDEVEIVGAPVTTGAERAIRLVACGKPYVCTTAAGRTNCKAALADVERPRQQAREEKTQTEDAPSRAADPPDDLLDRAAAAKWKKKTDPQKNDQPPAEEQPPKPVDPPKKPLKR